MEFEYAALARLEAKDREGATAAVDNIEGPGSRLALATLVVPRVSVAWLISSSSFPIPSAERSILLERSVERATDSRSASSVNKPSSKARELILVMPTDSPRVVDVMTVESIVAAVRVLALV